jgi:hypothetical protein
MRIRVDPGRGVDERFVRAGERLPGGAEIAAVPRPFIGAAG